MSVTCVSTFRSVLSRSLSTFLPRASLCISVNFASCDRRYKSKCDFPLPVDRDVTAKIAPLPVTTFRYACRLYFALFSLHTLTTRGKCNVRSIITRHTRESRRAGSARKVRAKIRASGYVRRANNFRNDVKGSDWRRARWSSRNRIG